MSHLVSSPPSSRSSPGGSGHHAREFKKLDGDAGRLYEDKQVWLKYSLFYDNFKKSYWMFFVPAIIYMFAKGCIIAGANGHGLVQAGGQLIVEALMLVLLLWTLALPAPKRSLGSTSSSTSCVCSAVICILVFVEELGISQTTKTITGVDIDRSPMRSHSSLGHLDCRERIDRLHQGQPTQEEEKRGGKD